MGVGMDVISVGRPAFASGGVAGHGNDEDYDSTWSVSGSGWLAYDLSGVPVQRRRSVVLAWYTSPDDGYSVSGMQGVCPVWSGRPYLGSYSVEVNAAAGGAVPSCMRLNHRRSWRILPRMLLPVSPILTPNLGQQTSA